MTGRNSFRLLFSICEIDFSHVTLILEKKKLKRDPKQPLTKKEKKEKRREGKDAHGVIGKLMEMYEKLRR